MCFVAMRNAYNRVVSQSLKPDLTEISFDCYKCTYTNRRSKRSVSCKILNYFSIISFCACVQSIKITKRLKRCFEILFAHCINTDKSSSEPLKAKQKLMEDDLSADVAMS